MRKIVLMIAAITFISVGSSGKGKEKVSEMFAKNTQLIHVGIGLNSYTTPVELSYEKGIKNDLFNVKGLNLGVGGYFNYFGYSTPVLTYTWKITNIVLGARALAHYKLIDKLDTYAGIMLGYDILSATLTPAMEGITAPSASAIFYGGVAGVRYEFSPKLGVYLEGGSASVSNASIGLAYKF